MKIAAVELHPYRRRLPRLVRGARLKAAWRAGWLLRLEDEAGGTSGTGWGEAACWPGFGAGPAQTAADLERVRRELPGQALDGVEALTALVVRLAAPEARHALELAGLDLLARRAGRPLAALLGPAPRREVAVHALVDDAVSAREAVLAGATTLKVKVGGKPLREDDLRVAAIRGAVGHEVALRLDANGGWTEAQAKLALDRLARFQPEWVEQPVPPDDLEALARLRKRGAVPVAADEALRDAAALERLLELEAVDAVVLKPMALGGLLAARALAARAAGAGLKVCITHSLEGAVGRAGALQLAAALPTAPTACGLGGALVDDVAPGFTPRQGRLELPEAPGLGLAPRLEEVPS